MTTPPTSLRDFYATPSNAWSFVPANLPGTPENATDLYSSAAGSSYEWSTRTNLNPLFDLSASYGVNEDGVDVKLVLQGLVTAALSSYASQALTMPFEVGKTLLQVQWIPRDTGELIAGGSATLDPADDEEEVCSCSVVVFGSSIVDIQYTAHTSLATHQMTMKHTLRIRLNSRPKGRRYPLLELLMNEATS